MFTGELAESRQTEVTIRDIDELAMELLIDFCYTSHIVIEESNVQTLLPAGSYFEINTTDNLSFSLLTVQYDTSICFVTWRSANDTKLKYSF